MLNMGSTFSRYYVLPRNIITTCHSNLSVETRITIFYQYSKKHSTSNPGPFGTEAAREKALVKSGHVTPQILDIFVTWPYYGYASTGGELIEVTEYFLNYLSKYIARDTNQDRKINVFMSFFYFRWDHVL